MHAEMKIIPKRKITRYSVFLLSFIVKDPVVWDTFFAQVACTAD
jgi:hypothetical protein